MAMGQGGRDSKRQGGIHVEAETDGEWPEHGAGERYAPGAKPHFALRQAPKPPNAAQARHIQE